MSSMATRRISDLQDFYSLLALLAVNVDGPRKLEACSGRLSWPQRGVYFWYDDQRDAHLRQPAASRAGRRRGRRLAPRWISSTGRPRADRCTEAWLCSIYEHVKELMNPRLPTHA